MNVRVNHPSDDAVFEGILAAINSPLSRRQLLKLKKLVRERAQHDDGLATLPCVRCGGTGSVHEPSVSCKRSPPEALRTARITVQVAEVDPAERRLVPTPLLRDSEVLADRGSQNPRQRLRLLSRATDSPVVVPEEPQ